MMVLSQALREHGAITTLLAPRAAVQRLKDLCVLVVEPAAAHALPLQALLLEGFAMRGGRGQR